MLAQRTGTQRTGATSLRRQGWLAAAMGLMVGLAAGGALADGARTLGTAAGTWAVNCEVDRMTDVRRCRLMIHREIGGGETGPEVVALSVVPAGQNLHLFVTTDLGVLSGCALRVDRRPHVETEVATFNMCMFSHFQAGTLDDQFRDGAAVLVRLILADGIGHRDVDFTLTGFQRAYEEMLGYLR